MRLSAISLVTLGLLAAGCSGGGTFNAPQSASDHAIVAREPMRLHALAVAVCSTPAPASPTSTTSVQSRCPSQQRVDLPPLPNSRGLTAAQIPGYEPSELRAAYDLPSSGAGVGKTIAIVIPYDNPNAQSDLAIYRAMFGLRPCLSQTGCFHKYGQNGSSALPAGNQTWGAEMSIDLDMVSAICPNCNIDVVEANSNDPSNLLQAMVTASSNLHASVVSNSWVTPEYAGERGAAVQLAKLSATVVAAAGDEGYGPAWPAAAATVVAVGGTTLMPNSSARGYTESVWSGTGGGCSAYIAKPAWQHDAGCANRTINDVAAVADPNPGVAVYDTYLPARYGGWLVFGGTSVATPIVAAAIALSSTSTAVSGSFISQHSALLNPITEGADGTCAPSHAYLCTAVRGYSGPAGYGSPNGVGAL